MKVFGRGEPVLFLHGNTASSRMFEDFVPVFAKKHRILLVDFFGHGKSGRVPKLATDLWCDEALQAGALLYHLDCGPATSLG